MSTLYRGRSDIHVVTDHGTVSYPNWQLSRDVAITKTVGGFLCTMTLDIPRACQPISLSWNGIQFLTAPDHGRGSGFAHNILFNALDETAWNYLSPTGPGADFDTMPLGGSSNCLAVGLNAAGDGATTIIKPAHWLPNDDQLVSTPGHPARNLRLLSEMITTTNYQIGLAGDDHIIQFDTYVVIPTDTQVQNLAVALLLIPCYFYAPDVGGTGFHVQKYVNTTTGATRAFPGYGNPGDTSTTEVVMSAYADGSAAIATVTGPGVLASGFHSGFSGSGFTSGFSKPRVNAAGFAAGTARVPGALCYGTEAQVISAIVTASASLPAASYT